MHRLNCIATASLVMLATAATSQAAIGPITSFGSPQSEDFNGLVNTGTANLSSIPLQFVTVETGTSANTTYSAGTGSSNAGDTYSFGASNSSERALGQVRSGNLISTTGLRIINNVTGGTLQSLLISYRGEQWRLGATGRNDKLDFQYSLDASSPTTGTWTDFNSLDFTAPVSTGTAGALDGNTNFIALSDTITGLNIPNGGSFWLRWLDVDATSSDDGLGIDDVTVRAGGVVPEPTTLAALSAIALIALRRRSA